MQHLSSDPPWAPQYLDPSLVYHREGSPRTNQELINSKKGVLRTNYGVDQGRSDASWVHLQLAPPACSRDKDFRVAESAKKFGVSREYSHIRKSWRLPLRYILAVYVLTGRLAGCSAKR